MRPRPFAADPKAPRSDRGRSAFGAGKVHRTFPGRASPPDPPARRGRSPPPAPLASADSRIGVAEGDHPSSHADAKRVRSEAGLASPCPGCGEQRCWTGPKAIGLTRLLTRDQAAIAGLPEVLGPLDRLPPPANCSGVEFGDAGVQLLARLWRKTQKSTAVIRDDRLRSQAAEVNERFSGLGVCAPRVTGEPGRGAKLPSPAPSPLPRSR